MPPAVQHNTKSVKAGLPRLRFATVMCGVFNLDCFRSSNHLLSSSRPPNCQAVGSKQKGRLFSSSELLDAHLAVAIRLQPKLSE